MRRAVVDLGSNSTLLLVAEQNGAIWRPVFESSVVTGFGRGVGASGCLGEEGMASALESLRQALTDAESQGVKELRAIGTMALRIATNADEFIERARRQGTPVSVLSGEDEARLGFISASKDPTFAELESIVSVDPGGHSTEIARRDAHHSFRIGTLGLLASPLASERPSVRERLAALEEVDEAMAGLSPLEPGAHAITLGATGTNLVSIKLGLAQWRPELVHGQWLDYADISNAFSQFCDLTLEERAALPGIENGRESTIHAGALILERALNALGAGGCYVSTRGWRHAFIAQ